MYCTNVVSTDNPTKILGFSKVSHIVNESEIPGLQNKTKFKSPTQSRVQSDTEMNVSDSKKKAQQLSMSTKVNSLKRKLKKTFQKIDSTKFPSSISIQSSWVHKISNIPDSNDSKASAAEVLGIPFYDPDYDHALNIELELDYLIKQTQNTTITDIMPFPTHLPNKDSICGSHFKSSPTPSSPPMRTTVPDPYARRKQPTPKPTIPPTLRPTTAPNTSTKQSSAYIHNLSKFDPVSRSSSSTATAAASVTGELQRLKGLQQQRRDMQDIIQQQLVRPYKDHLHHPQAPSCSDLYRYNENKENIMEDFNSSSSSSSSSLYQLNHVDRSLLLNQAQDVYSTFLHDLLTLSREKAHQCRSAETLAMHTVLCEHLATQCFAPRRIQSLLNTMSDAAIEANHTAATTP